MKEKKTVGLPISHKENERRRALIPEDIDKIKNKECLFFELGYGQALGISDDEYLKKGAQMATREEVLTKDIICDPKIGDADYLGELDSRTVFGWLHAVQNRSITDLLIKSKSTAYAWEDMFFEGRHVFWRNNEIAGEAAIMHAFQCYGLMPYNTKVALLGRGNVANGALKILTLLGADVTIYTRKLEALFRKELEKYDVIVNAILWDTARKDHIIYREDLKRMKKNAMIVDISCDRGGGIETCIPTTIEKPIYIVDGILHYAVDHTPSLFYKTATIEISKQVSLYLDYLITGEYNEVLEKSRCIESGIIIDKRIIDFQKR